MKLFSDRGAQPFAKLSSFALVAEPTPISCWFRERVQCAQVHHNVAELIFWERGLVEAPFNVLMLTLGEVGPINEICELVQVMCGQFASVAYQEP